MSVEQFLLERGWKRRMGGWEHQRLPDHLHTMDAAVCQCAQWLALELKEANDELESWRAIIEAAQSLAQLELGHRCAYWSDRAELTDKLFEAAAIEHLPYNYLTSAEGT